MNFNFKILIAGLAIIVVTNVIALVGVVYNRSGEPASVIELTERELRIPFSYELNKENSGLSLKINCRMEIEKRERQIGTVSMNCLGSPPWFDRKKLIDLGFELRPLPEKKKGRFPRDKTLPRNVYVVLEYDGAAYKRILSKREQMLAEAQAQLQDNLDSTESERQVKAAQNTLENERYISSRLFVIDAGLDKAALRSKYPDRTHYIVIQALVKPDWISSGDDYELTGMIEGMMNTTINVPLEYRAVFESLDPISPNDRMTQKPRYKVTVAFGKRGEPWIKGAELLSD